MKFLSAAQECYEILQNRGVIMLQNGGEGFVQCDIVLSCLLQILVDPFYRTMDGFCALIVREWHGSRHV